MQLTRRRRRFHCIGAQPGEGLNADDAAIIFSGASPFSKKAIAFRSRHAATLRAATRYAEVTTPFALLTPRLRRVPL